MHFDQWVIAIHLCNFLATVCVCLSLATCNMHSFCASSLPRLIAIIITNAFTYILFTYCIFVVFPLNSAHSASSVQKVKHDIPMNRYGKKLRLSAANRKGGEKNASNFVAGCAARVMHAIVASQMLRVPALREGQFFAIFRLCKRPRQRPLASTTTSISF